MDAKISRIVSRYLKAQEEMPYDSRPETQEHIDEVNSLIDIFIKELKERGKEHDQAKMKSPEVEIFDEFTPKLKDTPYGSDEYNQFLEDMQVGLDHHYEIYRHHPEHFEGDGIEGMNLIDLTEMFLDWLAATKRHADGDILESIEENTKRFNLSPQIVQILKNTAEHFSEHHAEL